MRSLQPASTQACALAVSIILGRSGSGLMSVEGVVALVANQVARLCSSRSWHTLNLRSLSWTKLAERIRGTFANGWCAAGDPLLADGGCCVDQLSRPICSGWRHGNRRPNHHRSWSAMVPWVQSWAADEDERVKYWSGRNLRPPAPRAGRFGMHSVASASP